MKQSILIKQLRGKLTQEEFAKRVGEDPSRISKYETEKHSIPLSRFLEWCEKLELETMINVK